MAIFFSTLTLYMYSVKKRKVVMTNPIYNPQPNYSGVTIQIANPAVNVVPNAVPNGNFTNGIQPGSVCCPSCLPCNCAESQINHAQYNNYTNPINSNQDTTPPALQAYPAEYYIKDFDKTKQHVSNTEHTQGNQNALNGQFDEQRKEAVFNDINTNTGTEYTNFVDPNAGISPYKDYAAKYEPKAPADMAASRNIIEDLDARSAEIKEAQKNTKESKIVALTDEYIKSLENYLNNPNDDIRLMASKEVLTRLDEDQNRYNDAALNALLNKMLQDPNKLVRVAALSAFASRLACGNDYTVQLLQNIQANPNADKEDALQAADILLKMSAGYETKRVPAGDEKREVYKMKAKKS